MGQVLSNDELKNELMVDYSFKTVNKEAIGMREQNIKAFNEINRDGLEHNKIEKRILLYETINNEKIYIQLPGKESIQNPKMPLDFRPKVQLLNGEITSDLSFGAIWDILDKIGKSHKAYLSYVATMFFRLGYMYGYQKTDSICRCDEIEYIHEVESGVRETEGIRLEWYSLDLSENIWLTLNDKIGWIDLGDERKISFEGFIKLVDLLFQNEDCKYFYKNVVIGKKQNYKFTNGRNKSSAANLVLLDYLEGNVKISELLDRFQKARGVPSFKKSDYSIVTDRMVVNIDVESRE